MTLSSLRDTTAIQGELPSPKPELQTEISSDYGGRACRDYL